jgi:hypothetical protein
MVKEGQKSMLNITSINFPSITDRKIAQIVQVMMIHTTNEYITCNKEDKPYYYIRNMILIKFINQLFIFI